MADEAAVLADIGEGVHAARAALLAGEAALMRDAREAFVGGLQRMKVSLAVALLRPRAPGFRLPDDLLPRATRQRPDRAAVEERILELRAQADALETSLTEQSHGR